MEQQTLENKLRRTAQLLFFKSHRIPGVKGWELKRSVGIGYPKIVKLLKSQIEPIGLSIRAIGDDGSELALDESDDRLSSARFLISISDQLHLADVKTSGWSIDELAGLTMCLATISSKGGKANRRELQETLAQKFPKWKIRNFISKYIRWGYLEENDDLIIIGWRTNAEVDLKQMLRYVFGA